MLSVVDTIKQMRDVSQISLTEAKKITDALIATGAVCHNSQKYGWTLTDAQVNDCKLKAVAFMRPAPTLWTLIVNGEPESVEATEANVNDAGVLSFVNAKGIVFRVLRNWDEVGLTNV
jgi:hypothetical protein